MPIYEYQCQSCEHRFEAIQKMSDDRLTDCPACHESALKKLVSAAAFKLKGGGWYETDFKHGQRGEAKAGQGGANDGGGDSDKSGVTAKSAEAKSTSDSTSTTSSNGSATTNSQSGSGSTTCWLSWTRPTF